MVKKYKQYIKESLLDKMVGPSEQEIIDNGLGLYLKTMIRDNNIEGVKKAITLGVDLNEEGTIFLYIAAIEGNYDIIKLLLENGIENEEPRLYFEMYEKKKNDIINLLENNFNTTLEDELKKNPQYYLKYGICESNKEIINEAIKLGADYKDEINLWFCIAKKSDISILKYFMFLGVNWDEDALNYYKKWQDDNTEVYNLLIDYKEAKNITNRFPIK